MYAKFFAIFLALAVATAPNMVYAQTSSQNIQVESGSSFNLAAASNMSVIDNEQGRYIAMHFKKFDGRDNIVLTNVDNSEQGTIYQIGLITLTIVDSLDVVYINRLLEGLGLDLRFDANKNVVRVVLD